MEQLFLNKTFSWFEHTDKIESVSFKFMETLKKGNYFKKT